MTALKLLYAKDVHDVCMPYYMIQIENDLAYFAVK